MQKKACLKIFPPLFLTIKPSRQLALGTEIVTWLHFFFDEAKYSFEIRGRNRGKALKSPFPDHLPSPQVTHCNSVNILTGCTSINRACSSRAFILHVPVVVLALSDAYRARCLHPRLSVNLHGEVLEGPAKDRNLLEGGWHNIMKAQIQASIYLII